MRVLLVDDEPSICEVLEAFLSDLGYDVVVSQNGREAIGLVDQPFDLALLDLSLPGATGLEVLHAFKRVHRRSPAIMLTAYATLQSALQALREGAYDFVTKPFDLQELQTLIERAMDGHRLIDENRYINDQLRTRYSFDNFIGDSPLVQRAYVLATRVAPSSATVLLRGETGTGKEFLARTIHYASSRAEQPFVCVNCSALPESLLESELFGHEKGAFTNALTRHIGRFELANKGTLFLDEIGDISASVQVKLLRVLQDKQFERVGGTETVRVDVRIIAATNKDLEAAMKSGDFRDDLYYRLSTVTLHLPPLRERQEDIPRLVQHFVKRHGEAEGKNHIQVTPEAMDMLTSCHWPGNMRELSNCIHRAVILAHDDLITADDLMLDAMETAPVVNGSFSAPAESAESAGGMAEMAGLPLREVEQRHILATLTQCNGNQTQAARLLGIDRKTLRAKIKAYGLPDDAGDE